MLSRVVAKSGNFEGPHCGEHDVKTVKNKGELAMLVFVFDFFGHLRLHQNLLGAHEDLGHENPYG